MKTSLFLQIMEQIKGLWEGLRPVQKGSAIALVGVLVILLAVMATRESKTQGVALFSAERLLPSDAAEVRAFLDRAQVAYETKGETGILVPENQVHKLRMELAASGLPKIHKDKGFELFDGNSWIKGDKELQIMEMRALKGQLERDIGEYENIKNATVSLDIAPQRSFLGSEYTTKASVILELHPGARLESSQLRAITYHLASAVRGLTPNMVAISDTSGKLYQAIDPEGDGDQLRNEEIATEERLKAKIDGMLTLILGSGNFYTTVEVRMSREQVVEEKGFAKEDAANGPVNHVKVKSLPGKVESISIGVMIDKTIALDTAIILQSEEIVKGQRRTEILRREIENQLAKILEGYNVKTQPAVDFVEFNKATPPIKIVIEEQKNGRTNPVTIILTVIALIIGMYGVVQAVAKRGSRKFEKIKDPPEANVEESPDVLRLLQQLEAPHLAATLANEETETIALLLSRLDKKSATAVIEQLPQERRPAIFLALANKRVSGKR